MNRYFLIIFLLISCGYLGCNNPLSLNSQNPIEIKTEKNRYHVSEDDSVKVTITNTSSETIYYSTCFAKTIEVIKEGKVIQTSGTPVCYCLCPAELKPGQTVPHHLSSFSTEALQTHLPEHDSGADPFAYRIKYSFYFDEAFGDEPVPEKFSRSNTFRITAN